MRLKDKERHQSVEILEWRLTCFFSVLCTPRHMSLDTRPYGAHKHSHRLGSCGLHAGISSTANASNRDAWIRNPWTTRRRGARNVSNAASASAGDVTVECCRTTGLQPDVSRPRGQESCNSGMYQTFNLFNVKMTYEMMRDIRRVEKIQRRFSKRLLGLAKLSYGEWLKR